MPDDNAIRNREKGYRFGTELLYVLTSPDNNVIRDCSWPIVLVPSVTVFQLPRMTLSSGTLISLLRFLSL